MGPEVFRCQGLNSWENKIVDTGHVDSEENPGEKRDGLLVRSKNVLKQPKNEDLDNPRSKMSNCSYGILSLLQVG